MSSELRVCLNTVSVIRGLKLLSCSSHGNKRHLKTVQRPVCCPGDVIWKQVIKILQERDRKQ
jgi:hypothetical protein